MEPIPYNITLLSQTASFSYLPTREGKPDAGWSSVYPLGSRDTGYGRNQGIGSDYHKSSFAGASLEFTFTGTAVYLYGTAAVSDAYKVSVDGTDVDSKGLPTGVLGSKTRLKYEEHTVQLKVLGKGEVAFNRAEVTIGVGFPGNSIQNRTIKATNEATTPLPNPYFRFRGPPSKESWQVEPVSRNVFRADGTSYQLTRQLITSIQGDPLSFTVTNATAFFLYGAVNFDHGGGKTATITPASTSQGKSTPIDDSSDLLDFDQVIYWQSGLNRDETYTVELYNGSPTRPTMSFNRLELIDGGSGSAGKQPYRSTTNKPGAGVIAGITIGSVFITGCIVLAFLFWRRYRRISRRKRLDNKGIFLDTMDVHTIPPYTEIGPADKPGHHPQAFKSDIIPPALTSSTSSYSGGITGLSSTRAVDAGSIHGLLPPEYQNEWSQQHEPFSSKA